MTHIEPDQARRVLDDHKVHGTHISPTDAQQALETIATDTVKWAVMLTSGTTDYIDDDWWYPTKDEAMKTLRAVEREKR